MTRLDRMGVKHPVCECGADMDYCECLQFERHGDETWYELRCEL